MQVFYSVHPSPFVLRACVHFIYLPPEDRDYTDSRRIEPNSRSTLTGEQPDPSYLLQQGDVLSRHRGGKQRGRYELSRAITLLSLA